MTVLVTGAAGFIGSHVVDHCLAQGLKVIATDDLSGGFRENVPAAALWVQGDLRDPKFVARLWAEQGPFEYVYHLAAYAAEGLSHFIRRFNYETNIGASMNLINAAVNHGTRTVVFASSIAVYGRGQTPMTEALEPRPRPQTAALLPQGHRRPVAGCHARGASIRPAHHSDDDVRHGGNGGGAAGAFVPAARAAG